MFSTMGWSSAEFSKGSKSCASASSVQDGDWASCAAWLCCSLFGCPGHPECHVGPHHPSMGTCLQVSGHGEAISAGQKGSGPLKGHLQKGHFVGILAPLEGSPPHLLLQPVLAHSLTWGCPQTPRADAPAEAGARGPLLCPSQDVPLNPDLPPGSLTP